MLCDVMLYYITLHYSIVHHVILYHIISYHIISYHIIHIGGLRGCFRTDLRVADLQTGHPLLAFVGIHYRGVQWEGGAVDGGSIIQ